MTMIPSRGGHGPQYLIVTVDEVNVVEGVATVKDSYGRRMQVRADHRRGAGRYPRAGDIWIVDRSMGTWTFSTLVQDEPPDIAANLGVAAFQGLLNALGDMGLIAATSFAGAYLLGESIYFTSSGSFDKVNFPGLRAVRVRCQGGGGGSGGTVATGAGEVAVSGGGGGGGYSESLILASNLAESEAVTVGDGGTAGAAGLNDGGGGTKSAFDTLSGEVNGLGGTGGGHSNAAGDALSRVPGFPGSGGDGTGDLVIPGSDAISGFALLINRVYVSLGGASHLSGFQGRGVSGGASVGAPGKQWGGGAQGGANAQNSAASAGAVGGVGIVIAEPLY